MKLLISLLFIVSITSTIQANIMVIKATGHILTLNGVVEKGFMHNSNFETYDAFIKRKTGCQNYKVINIIDPYATWPEIIIDCKDKGKVNE